MIQLEGVYVVLGRVFMKELKDDERLSVRARNATIRTGLGVQSGRGNGRGFGMVGPFGRRFMRQTTELSSGTYRKRPGV